LGKVGAGFGNSERRHIVYLEPLTRLVNYWKHVKWFKTQGCSKVGGSASNPKARRLKS